MSPRQIAQLPMTHAIYFVPLDLHDRIGKKWYKNSSDEMRGHVLQHKIKEILLCKHLNYNIKNIVGKF